MSFPLVDATSHAPRTALYVRIHGTLQPREGLETAWLLLAEHDGVRTAAARALADLGWDLTQALELVRVAEGWTGNVVAGEVR